MSVFVPYCAPEQSKYAQCYPDEARFKADAGEANRLTITRSVEGPQFTPVVAYHDDDAPVHPGSGCRQVDDHTASCTGYLLTPVVDTGDRDDVISGTGTIDAGEGNDTITGDGVLIGGPGDDALQGGDANDTLLGGAGRDSLSGGAGNDTLQPDDGEPGELDAVDGGDGIDIVSYERRKDDVTVSLQQPLAGEDRLSAVEGVRGGSGNDTLTGDAGANALDGGPGDDRLTGGEGDDVLDGGAGADVLDGGDGRDLLYSGGDAGHNLLACGDGIDRVMQLGRDTLVAASCERMLVNELELMLKAIALHLPAPRAGDPLVLLDGLACVERPCSAALRVTIASGRHAGLVAAGRKFGLRAHAKPPRRLAVVLRPAAAALIRHGAAATARVDIALRDGGDRARVSFLIGLGHIALGVPSTDG